MNVMSKSPWVVHYNCNSCNGCDIEFLALLTPMYDLERFGILHVGNPKHADVLVVTGSVNHRNARVLRNVYAQIPEPKVVVAMGVCTASGGIYDGAYNILGGIDRVIPVDVFVCGCPPKPEAMIDGIIKAAGILEEKRLGRAVAKPDKNASVMLQPPPKPEGQATEKPAETAIAKQTELVGSATC